MSEPKPISIGKAWVAFVICMLLGAGLLLNSSAEAQIWGFILLFAPLLYFGGWMALSFALQKRRHQ